VTEQLAATRRSLHGVAETVVAGPQFRATGTMRLAVVPGGFATTRRYGDVRRVAVEGAELVVTRAGEERLPLTGSYAELARAAGLELGGLEGAYRDGAHVRPEDLVEVDAGAAAELAEAWGIGDRALRALGDGAQTPVLWPEHFDVAVTLDGVNFGLSPGDEFVPVPYAYVGPPRTLTGPFWNQPFGAARPLRDLGDESGVLAFFREGRRLAG
jgi:hypothetical protein